MTDLPNDWVAMTLGEVADWGSGGTPQAGNPRYYGGEIPWAIIGDLNDGEVYGTGKTITQEGLVNSSAKMVPVGALLIAMYGSIGKMGIAKVPMATNQAIAFASPKANLVIPKYLFWYLRSQREIFLSRGKGATQQNISQTLLKAWEIPVPSLDEQKRIVEALDGHLSILDKSQAAIEASNLKASEFRRALLDKALFRDSGLPFTTLGDHIQTRKNKGIPAQEPRARYLGLEHVEPHGGRALGFDSAGDYRSSSPIVEEGDLLYGRLRPYLNKVVIAPERLYASGEFIVMEPSKTLRTSFLKYLLMSPRFLAFTASLDTGDRPRVSWDKIEKFQFQLPDLGRQKRIVEQIDASLALTASMQDNFADLTRSFHTLRRSLLKAAFSGKLRNG